MNREQSTFECLLRGEAYEQSFRQLTNTATVALDRYHETMACDPDAHQPHTLGLETLPLDHSVARQKSSRRASPPGVPRPNKFGAVPTTVDAIRFASKKESRRYLDLKLMEKAGLIRDLECQPKFPIHIVPQSCWGNGAVVPVRVATYIADFSYYDVETRSVVVEDVKSKATRTALYRLKKKLIEAQHDITITEV